ncbi:MAG TPA: hypothetical protein VEN81_14830 [Planctomycetota bacterium]|nr:hypothetical protein [Planctomycetota bacterium]
MIPEIILNRLSRLRARERRVRLAWGLARLLAIAAGAMLVACGVDWLVDLRTETPLGLRRLLLAAQIALWAFTGFRFVVAPLRDPLSDRDLALWSEGKFPELGHRIITAVELNRPAAPLEGMSTELLAAVTRQAEDCATRTDFSSRVDVGRLHRGAALAAATSGLALLVGLAAPQTARALLERQFLADREIPRSVAIEPELVDLVRPSGEEVRIRFRAKGSVPLEGLSGTIRIEPKERPEEEYPLAFEARDEKLGATFLATIPPASVDFGYRAWLRDGRSRKPAQVRYVPRPVVQKIDAWVLLPKYVGLRPDGTPYEQYRLRGEIAGPLGSAARVEIATQKPVARGKIELMGRAGGESTAESVLRTQDLAIRSGGLVGVGVFELRAGETSYRILVEDEYGFGNSTPPKRGIAIVAEEPPRVVLLPERFTLPGETLLTDDAEVEGMPIPLGSAVRIAYYCAHPYGLDRTALAYRVIKGNRSSEEAGPEIPWKILPLGEVRGSAEVGPFDLRRGLFEKTGFRDQVEFHPLPSADPEHVHGRVEGGGCFDFQTKPIVGLQVGDQIELRIEAYARNPALAGSPGRSETRVKAFVTQPQFMEWVLQTLKHESRIRQLESRQKGVFTPEGDR